MTRALRFTKTEIANAAKLCREHNVVVKLTRDGDMLVFPDPGKPVTIDSSDDDPDADWAAYEARNGGG